MPIFPNVKARELRPFSRKKGAREHHSGKEHTRQHCRNHHDKNIPSPRLKNKMFNCVFETFCVLHSTSEASLYTGLQDL